MLKEFKKKLLFIWLIEHFEEAIDAVLRLWAVFEVLDVITNDLSICNQEAFAINDVWDHHNLIKFGVWEL